MGKEKRTHVTVLRKPERESLKWSRIYGYEGCGRDICNCESDPPCDSGCGMDCAPTWGGIKSRFA